MVGSLLIPFSILLLWSAEKHAVDFTVILARCKKACKIIYETNKVEPQYEGRAVYLNGITQVKDISPPTAEDSSTKFHVLGDEKAIRLKRTAEVFQWIEHKKEEEKRTIYTYSMEWSEDDHNSSRFRDSATHYNPPRHPNIVSRITNSKRVTVGAYELSQEQIEKFHHWNICDISNRRSTGIGEFDSKDHGGDIEKGEKRHNSENEVYTNLSQDTVTDSADYIVFNGSLSNPKPGTLRVSYEAIYEGGPVSLVGVQTGTTFRPFTKHDAHRFPSSFSCCYVNNTDQISDKDLNEQLEGEIGCCCLSQFAEMIVGTIVGTSVLLLEERETSADRLFYDEQVKLSKRLNLSRLGGCLLLAIGLYLITNPVSVFLSFIPYFSGLLSNLLWLVALVLGFALGGVVIALAWLEHHPEILFGECMDPAKSILKSHCHVFGPHFCCIVLRSPTNLSSSVLPPS